MLMEGRDKVHFHKSQNIIRWIDLVRSGVMNTSVSSIASYKGVGAMGFPLSRNSICLLYNCKKALWYTSEYYTQYTPTDW